MTKHNVSISGKISGGQAVADYLAGHLDFFVQHEELLLKMELPHQKGKTISLVEKQVSLLRERNLQSRKQLDEMLLAATRNSDIFNKCKKLFVQLLDAQDPDSFFGALENSFKNDFKSTAYSLIVFSNNPGQINHFTSRYKGHAAREYVGSLMDASEPTLGVLRPEEQDFLFRHASSKVKSAAVVPVRNQHDIALLAIGSSDPNYFQVGMGTIFIGFIADIMSRLLPKMVS